MISRAKLKGLFKGRELNAVQMRNSELNIREMEEGATILASYPRRIVFELTNACNLDCIMCGRAAKDFCVAYLPLSRIEYFESIFHEVEEVALLGWGEPTTHPNFAEALSIINKHPPRKYLYTNGMRLFHLQNVIFDSRIDILAVSLDGATSATNDRIRRNSDFNYVIKSLNGIAQKKRDMGVEWPYLRLVFCAMKSNINELQQLIDLAAKIGVNSVKVVYCTVFSRELLGECLWGEDAEIKLMFEKAALKADSCGIELELPFLFGDDPCEDKLHKDCSAVWRDLYIGSDGFIRPCMSTSDRILELDMSLEFGDIWNSSEFQNYRANVNNPDKMSESCKNCYHSTFCSWNRRQSLMQIDNAFAPTWSDLL